MLHNLFPSPVYDVELSLDTKPVASYCLDLKKKSNNILKSNVGGWQSSPLDKEPLPLKALFKSIVNHANKFNEVLRFKNPLRLGNSWININGYRDYNIEHIHPGAALSGVYYIKSNSNSGNLRFLHPTKDLMSYDWSGLSWKEPNEYNSLTWWFAPIENKLFLFPSWLRHYVDPNLNKEEERISISFNLICSS